MFNFVVVEPEIPPNAGNIIRIASATGSTVHLVEPLGFGVTDKHFKRAGLDYWERAPLTVHSDWDALVEAEHLATKRVFAFTTTSSTSAFDASFQPGDWFVFGRESRGLDQHVLDAFDPDYRLRIPMREGHRSLNLANSVAIVAFEAWRQNGFTGGLVT